MAFLFSVALFCAGNIDEVALHSLFFRSSNGGFGACARFVNWVVSHAVLVALLRWCDQGVDDHQESWPPSSSATLVAFLGLSYLNVVFSMAVAARHHALGQDSRQGLYKVAVAPTIVYAFFLAFVILRSPLASLSSIVTRDAVFVLSLPLIHAVLFGQRILSLFPRLARWRAQPAAMADTPTSPTSTRREFPTSFLRAGYVALSVTLWWLAPPSKVARLLEEAPTVMLAEFRSLSAPPIELLAKVAGSLIVFIAGVGLLFGAALAARIALRLNSVVTPSGFSASADPRSQTPISRDQRQRS